MTKYKLVKTYPGSPELGTVVEEKCKTSSFYMFNGNAILRKHVEDNPEYWEKVNDDLWWVVFTKEDTIFESYYPYCLETSVFKAQDSRQYFKTKEEAEEYILYNKPCLCLNNIRYLLDKEQRSTVELLIKSKL